MKLKEYRIRDTGNSVANYTEEVHQCDMCEGRSVVEDENGVEVECQECGGKGEYTVRR